LLVDSQNIWFSARERFGKGARIDFKKLRDRVERGRLLAMSYALAFIPWAERAHPITKALRKLGYEWQERAEDFSIQLAELERWLWREEHTLSTLAIASGDGGFCDVMAHARERQVRVELYTFRDVAMNKDLPQHADQVTELGAEVLLGDFATFGKFHMDDPD